MEFVLDPTLRSKIKRIRDSLGFSHIKPEKIFTFKSRGSKSRAIARIWSLPKIWQIALKTDASYCIEVISEKFDRLKQEDQDKVLIHELLHIPKNFSGSLLSHNQNGRRINKKVVEKLYQEMIKKERR